LRVANFYGVVKLEACYVAVPGVCSQDIGAALSFLRRLTMCVVSIVAAAALCRLAISGHIACARQLGSGVSWLRNGNLDYSQH
jgi:hypothetical protein